MSFVPVPRWMLMALSKLELPGREARALCLLILETIGFEQRETARLALDYVATSIGVDRSGASRCVSSLVTRGLACQQPPQGRQRVYGLNRNPEAWSPAGEVSHARGYVNVKHWLLKALLRIELSPAAFRIVCWLLLHQAAFGKRELPLSLPALAAAVAADKSVCSRALADLTDRGLVARRCEPRPWQPASYALCPDPDAWRRVVEAATNLVAKSAIKRGRRVVGTTTKHCQIHNQTLSNSQPNGVKFATKQVVEQAIESDEIGFSGFPKNLAKKPCNKPCKETTSNVQPGPSSGPERADDVVHSISDQRLWRDLVGHGINPERARYFVEHRSEEVIRAGIARLAVVKPKNPAAYLARELDRGGYGAAVDPQQAVRELHEKTHQRRRQERVQDSAEADEGALRTARALEFFAELPADDQAQLCAETESEAQAGGFWRLRDFRPDLTHVAFRGLLVEVIRRRWPEVDHRPTG